MLRRLENIGGFLSFRDASIRAKVMFAFLGVLLLILPQIVLTVTYMVALFEDGDSVERSSSASLILGKMHTQLEKTLLVPYPTTKEALETELNAIEEVIATVEKAEERFGQWKLKDARFQHYLVMLEQTRTELRSYLTLLEPEVNAMLSVVPPVTRREVTSRIHQELDDLYRTWDDPVLAEETQDSEGPEQRLAFLRSKAFKAIKEVVSAQNRDDAATTTNLLNRGRKVDESWKRRRAILGMVGTLRARVNSDNALAADQIKESVDEANRYLITLVLLTLVYIFVVILVLPSRLVRPLVHFSSVMQRAATGQLEVRARVVGDDEMGDMGKGLNTMLERLGTFDRLKRDRIYEDSARLRALGERIEAPIAILDTSFAFEYANQAMRKLLSLNDDYEGRELTSVVEGRQLNDLLGLLDKALKRRRRLEGVVLEIETKQGVKKLTVSTEVGRNRAGQISYLILSLSEQT